MGDNIQVTIKWAVPNSYNKNTINIDVKGSRRNLNMEVKYDFSQIDFNINTANKSPIITNMDLTYDSKAKDLVGSMSKSFNGRLYEITFPKGSGMGALPKFNFAG